MTKKKQSAVTSEDYQNAAKNPLTANGNATKDSKKQPAKKAPAKKGAAKKGPGGRPPVPREKFEEVIERMCEGESLLQICKDPSMPSRGTVLNYAYLHRDSDDPWVKNFSEAYRIAAEVRSESWAEEILGIADGTPADGDEIALSKLQIEARKWLLSKINSKYNEKTAHEISGPGGGPVQSESSVTFYIPDNSRQDQSLEQESGEEDDTQSD